MKRKKSKLHEKALSLTSKDRDLIATLHNQKELFNGLSVQDKLAVAANVRGVGAKSRFFKSLFKRPTKDDYNAISIAATKAILNRNGNGIRPEKAKVAIRLPYNYRELSNDFPYALAIDADITTTTVRVNACALVDWLYSKGHVSYSSKQLREGLRNIKPRLREVEDDLAFIRDYCVDSAFLGIIEDML